MYYNSPVIPRKPRAAHVFGQPRPLAKPTQGVFKPRVRAMQIGGGKLPNRITHHPILASPDINIGHQVQIGDSMYIVVPDREGLGGFSLKKIGKAIGKAAKQTVNVVKKAAPIALAFAPIPIVGNLVNKALNVQKSVKSIGLVKSVGAVQKNLIPRDRGGATSIMPPPEAAPVPQYVAPPAAPQQDIVAILAQRDAAAAATRAANQTARAQRKAEADAAAAAKKQADDAAKAARKADRARAKAEAATAAAAADAGNAAKQEAARVAAEQAALAVVGGLVVYRATVPMSRYRQMRRRPLTLRRVMGWRRCYQSRWPLV
jgi:hypothetical protein